MTTEERSVSRGRDIVSRTKPFESWHAESLFDHGDRCRLAAVVPVTLFAVILLLVDVFRAS